MLALQPLFQSLDLFLELALGAVWRQRLEDSRSVLEKQLLPLIEEAGIDPVLFAQVRHRFAFQQVQPQDFDLVFGTDVPPLLLAHTVPF